MSKATVESLTSLSLHDVSNLDEIKSEWDFKLPDAVPSLDRRTQSTDR